jgi:hypothetical protein
MKAASSHFAPGRLSKSENVVSDCQGIAAAAIASAVSYVLNRSFFISRENRFFTDFFESFAVLMRGG